MSENIEKAVQTEESSETKGTDNVVLYPVSDEEKTVSAAQETSDTESKAILMTMLFKNIMVVVQIM